MEPTRLTHNCRTMRLAILLSAALLPGACVDSDKIYTDRPIFDDPKAAT